MKDHSRYIAAGGFLLLALISVPVSPWLVGICACLAVLVIAEGFDL